MNDTLSWHKHRHIIILLIVFLSLLCFTSAFMPPEAVWITDNGNKLMIMHNYLDNDTIFFDHVSPENFPKGGFHFQTLENGRITSFHSPYLPVLTAFVYRITGPIGISMIPALSLAGIAALLFLFPGKRYWTFAMLGATPLIFYSLLLWEMLPAALAVTLAAWYFFRRRYTLAGVIFGCGIWMREELYVLGFALVIALLLKKRWRVILKFAAGATLPVLALWGANYWLFGHVAGVHGTTYFVNNRDGEFSLLIQIKEVLFNFYQHLIRFETLKSLWSWLIPVIGIVPLLIAGIAPGYSRWKKFKLAAGMVFALCAVICAFALWKHQNYLLICAFTFGLFISVPVLSGFFLNFRALLGDRHWQISTAAATVILYIIFTPFLLNPNDIGLTWGARHFIMILPLMLLLGNYALQKNGFFKNLPGKSMILLCIIAGAVMQIYALNALVKVTNETEFLQHEILSLPPDTVISDIFFLPEMTPLVPEVKNQLEVTDEKQLKAALEYLETSKMESFILILSPDYRRISNDDLRQLLYRYPPRMRPATVKVGNSLVFMITVCVKR